MKTLISIVLAFFFSLSLFAQNQAELKLNLEKNKTYRAKSTSDQTLTQTYMDQPHTSQVKTSNTLSVKAISIEADVINAEIRFDTITYSNTMPKMEVASYKGGSFTSTDPADAMNLIVNRLSKSTLKVKLSNAGKVLEISNLKIVADSVLAGVDSLKGQSGMMAQMQGKSLVSEDGLKGMIEMITAFLPGKKVQTGDKWDSKIKVSSGGIGILISCNYKLKKVTGNQAEIKGDAINEPAGSDPINMGGAEITYQVRGLGEVTLTVDTKTGWIIKGSSKSHSQGNVAVKAQGQEFQVPTEVDGTSEITAL